MELVTKERPARKRRTFVLLFLMISQFSQTIFSSQTCTSIWLQSFPWDAQVDDLVKAKESNIQAVLSTSSSGQVTQASLSVPELLKAMTKGYGSEQNMLSQHGFSQSQAAKSPFAGTGGGGGGGGSGGSPGGGAAGGAGGGEVGRGNGAQANLGGYFATNGGGQNAGF